MKDSGCDKLQCICGYRVCWKCKTAKAACNCNPGHGFIDNVTGFASWGETKVASKEELKDLKTFLEKKRSKKDSIHNSIDLLAGIFGNPPHNMGGSPFFSHLPRPGQSMQDWRRRTPSSMPTLLSRRESRAAMRWGTLPPSTLPSPPMIPSALLSGTAPFHPGLPGPPPLPPPPSFGGIAFPALDAGGTASFRFRPSPPTPSLLSSIRHNANPQPQSQQQYPPQTSPGANKIIHCIIQEDLKQAADIYKTEMEKCGGSPPPWAAELSIWVRRGLMKQGMDIHVGARMFPGVRL